MYSAGIDIGGTLTKLALVRTDGEVLGCETVPTRTATGPHVMLATMRASLEHLARAAKLAWPPPGGCGIGIPGVIDWNSGGVIFSGPLDWHHIPFGEMASTALGCTTVVDTDVNAGALSDLYFGCAPDASDLLYISWGTGIGAGFACGRKLYHSRGNAMCNFGHMPADPSSDRLCYCGCRGCLEVEAGGKAMVEQAGIRLAAGERSRLSTAAAALTPEAIAQAAALGDRLARSILERSAILMARVLAGLLAFLNPDTVVFGGGVSQCLPQVRPIFDQELGRRAPSFSLPLTRILRSSFGPQAGVVGAAMLPRNRMDP
ncbi:MAG TPA: ROK family protein [Bryobacteraceae bacterium]|nr:ROK family protein [Bryobacteraceae bacterium]